MVAVENSFPVADGVPGRGRIETAVLPACTVLSIEHWGPTTSSTARTALQARGARRARASGDPREIYWTGPEEVPVEKWLTEVQLPVVRDDAKLAAFA